MDNLIVTRFEAETFYFEIVLSILLFLRKMNYVRFDSPKCNISNVVEF